MATYSSVDLNTKVVYSGCEGNAYIYFGTSAAPTANFTTADKVRLGRIPAGTKVTAVCISNTVFGSSTAPATIQFEPVDGSTPVQFGTTDGVPLGSASANGTWYHKDAVTVAKNSYITLLAGTVAATGNTTGVASITVLGEYFGSK
jgi:hypothetical protein